MPARAPALSAGCPFRPGLTAARSFRPPRPSVEGYSRCWQRPHRHRAAVIRCTGANKPDQGTEKRPAWRKKYKQLLPFDEVGGWHRNKDDWDDWLNEGKKSPWFGPYMPSEPDMVYEEEWEGWEDFLGLPLPFEQARLMARSLNLKAQEEWWAYASGGGAGGVKAAADKAAAEGKGASAVYRAASKAAHRLRSLKEERKHPNLPAMPHIYYRDEWKGYDDWLGLEERVLTVPKDLGQDDDDAAATDDSSPDE